MKPHACFRISVDELAQDIGNYIELAKTRTFEIYDRGEVEVMLVRISAIPDWDEQLQKSIRTDMMTKTERDEFRTLPEDMSQVPDSYDDWPDEAE